ncbi:TPR repeat-containing thioredoxin TTL1-like protein [Carex littledalei]|uniref:TPR repeat-containing thioredoxin TTL1-like protein n=1 Tax=Carex littledalei TaxID=544730 RepID=A0A833RRA4_9POAL|nr:TPR repeat-containing thioredoxin TTL1-like protein [Carex littledalei]
MSKPRKQESTNTKKDGKTIVESSSNLQLGSSSTSNADRINWESFTISGSNPHWGSSSTSNVNTISRKSSIINGKSYKDACLGIDPVVRNSQTNTINSMCQVDTLFNGGQFEEALKGYEEIHRLDPTNPEVNDKISRCHLSLRILKYWEALPKKIKKLEDRLEKKLSEKTKEVEDQLDNSYMTALKEVDSSIAAGTTSRYILAIKADLLLCLNRPDQAEETISKALKLEPELQSPLSLGMVSESYVCIIQAKVELALGRFENAVVAARQAHILDPLNDEVNTILENVHMAKLARDKGDNMFRSGKYMEASEKYMIGLNYAWPNIALLYKLATCHRRLCQWEKCIKFCNHALKFSENNPVDPCLFANPFTELGKSDESVKDYEEQVPLKASLGEDISDIKFKRGVEEVNSIEQYKVAISAPGPTIVFFMDPSKAECTEFSSFVESLCISFPLANFLEVDINRCPLIAKSENVQVVPAFKIYNCRKNVKFMINPERIYLKFWVQIYTV